MPTIIIYGLVFFVFFIPCLSLFIYIWYCIRVYTILFRRSVFKRSYERTLFQNSDLDYCPFINILPFPSLILLLQLLQKPSQCSVLCSQISFSFNKKKFIQKFRTAFQLELAKKRAEKICLYYKKTQLFYLNAHILLHGCDKLQLKTRFIEYHFKQN